MSRSPQPAAQTEEEEYGEFLAGPKELVALPVNDIATSVRLNAGAISFGRKVYDKACAGRHGADLKGIPDRRTPDLTDGEWRFSGDDLPSDGNIKFPSDVECSEAGRQSRGLQFRCFVAAQAVEERHAWG